MTETTASSTSDEKSILDAALAIMAERLGSPCGFRALLAPGTSSVEVVFRPANNAGDAGYIGATLSSGPLSGETHERHSDLPDGNYDRRTLDAVVKALQNEIEEAMP